MFLCRKHLAAGNPLNMVLVEANAGRLARLKQEMAALVAKYGNEPGPLNPPRYHAITFGLIIEDGHGVDWAELYPDRLGFRAPWDGSYDT